jgi:Zn-dependent protease
LFNTGRSLYDYIILIPAILVAFTFHEYAHAYMADRLGDKTPKFQGRLTLNPLAHIDPIGFIMILLVGFGWAKPVQTNPRSYKNYYKDDLKVSIVGPMANLAVALIFALLLGVYYRFFLSNILNSQLFMTVHDIMVGIVRINVVLFIFNLLPLPGLDGFHVLCDLIPSAMYKVSDYLYRFRVFILIAFVATPISRYIIWQPALKIIELLQMIINLIAGF